MIIVTGAAGFIGSALVWELNERGINDIFCVDLYRDTGKWKNLAKRDITDFLDKDYLFEFLELPEIKRKVKAIFHMGACSSTTEHDMDYLLVNNHYYTQTLFEWCAKNKKPFIYASSGATYGDGEHGYDDKTDPQELIPLNPYGYSKLTFDRWALKQKKTPPQWVGLKFFNVFGPHEYHKGSMASVAYHAYNQINENGSLKLFKSHNPEYKDGKQMRDFVYVKDVTRWMFEIYQKPKINGIFNMGFGKARTWLDLAEGVFKNMNKPMKIDWIDIPPHLRNQYQYFTEAKMDKLLKTGVSKPQWPLEKALEDYVKNYLLKKDQYL